MFREKVEQLLNQALKEHPSLFLIDLNIDSTNGVKVIIDGDQGVTLNDCIAISRAVEHNIDREEFDFSIDVMSAGVSEPLQLPRQFHKNKNRNLEVVTHSGETVKGTLIEITDNDIQLTWKTREPKPVGKGKITVTKEANIPFAEIKQAKVMINFN